MSRRLDRRFAVLEIVLVACVLALAGTTFALHVIGATSWLIGMTVLAVGLIMVVGAKSTVRRMVSPIERAIEEVEETVRASGERLSAPTFSRSTRLLLPEMTGAIDDAIDRMRKSYARMADVALTDAVTSLPNRQYFTSALETELAPASAGGPPPPCALLFIDLDQFKAVNDRLGHAVGDELLRAFAGRVMRLLRRGNATFARLAGDEFTILLPGAGGVAGAERIAARILDALREPFSVAENRLAIGASIGIAYAPRHGTDVDSLLQSADKAMYRAKADGRSRVRLFSDDLGADEAAAGDNARALGAALRGAARAGEFVLHLQPQIDVATGSVIGAETLIRWNHPERGLVMPGDFIPLAEDRGLIAEIGQWVLTEALAMIEDLPELGDGSRLSINVSMRQLETDIFVDTVERALAESGVDPRRLELEMTESLVMLDASILGPKLTRLRRLGVSVAIDDFGTGYSNLARLRSLPIDRLKIDRSIVADVGHSESARTIVQTIVGLAHGLGYQVVAEGVERPAEQDLLAVIGCDAVQGFGIAKPMPKAAFRDWLQMRRTTTLRPLAGTLSSSS
ncbi:MAG: EAL domain-containing protein [Pseudomonadota bacterium]